MHTLRILLDTHGCEAEMEKRFHVMTHIHSVCISHMKKLLGRLEHDEHDQTYQKQLASYLAQRKELARLEQRQDPSADELHQLSDLEKQVKKQSKALTVYRSSMGLSKAGLESYIKVCGKQFRHLISSQQVQAEADRVWQGVEKCLFSDGREIHYQKRTDCLSISGKSNLNGAKFDANAMTVAWTGLTLSCVIRKDRASYVAESLNGPVSCCEIVRKQFPSGWRYYANLYIKSDAPHSGRKSGKGSMGIDPGVSTVAAAGEQAVFLEELAPRVPEYNRKITDLQYHLEASRRSTNPGKYREDGTINRNNHDRWKHSKAYKRTMRKLRTVYRKKAAYIRQCHEELANRLLAAADSIYVEHMEFKALQKRAKETKRQDNASPVKQKDGTTKNVFRVKRRKRFGRSMNNRAPAQFLAILSRKAVMLGVPIREINTVTYKASQYDHTTGDCIKVPLSKRSKEITGHTVQRDLYSAFLIQNPEDNLKYPDRKKCTKHFSRFLKLHDALIGHLKSTGQSMPQCFGF